MYDILLAVGETGDYFPATPHEEYGVLRWRSRVCPVFVALFVEKAGVKPSA